MKKLFEHSTGRSPQCSVLMSIYSKNTTEEVLTSFRSIESQSQANLEVVIIIDGPVEKELLDRTINSAKHIHKKFINFTVLQLNVNRGLGAALNVGIALIRSPYIIRFDCDDISIEDRGKIQFDILTEDMNIGVTSSYVTEHSNLLEKHLRVKTCALHTEQAKKISHIYSPVNHPSSAIRLDALKESGGYNEHIKFHEDYILWLSMLANGWKVHGTKEILVKMKVDSNLYRRRGGFEYACLAIKARLMLYKINVFTLKQALLGVFISGLYRLLPTFLRKQILFIFMRKNG